MTEQVRVPAGAVPPMPAGGYERGAAPLGTPDTLPQANQVPGFVPPAAAPVQGELFSPEQLAAAAAYLQSKQAPVTPVVPVAAPAPAKVPDASLANTPIDDAVLESKVRLFRTFAEGVDIDRVLGAALTSGDESRIDIQYLKDAAGDKANDLLAIAKDIVQNVNQTAEAGTRAAYEIAGGEQNWNTAAAVFNEKAPRYMKEFVGNLLQSQSADKLKTAAEAVVDFAKQQGQIIQPAQLLQGQGAAPAQAGLSADAFREAARALNPYSPDFEAQRNALLQRRQFGKQSGL